MDDIQSETGDTLEGLRQRLAEFARERDWDRFHSPKNLSMALIAEAAELVEHFQWLSEEQSWQLGEDKRRAVAEELADILIYTVRAADRLGIDLVRAAREKVALNERRYPAALVRGDARRASEYAQAREGQARESE